jgi:hypothetical protein
VLTHQVFCPAKNYSGDDKIQLMLFRVLYEILRRLPLLKDKRVKR